MSFTFSNLNAQTSIKGHIKLDSTWAPVVYLSLIPNMDEMLDISNEMIKQTANIDSEGKFYFNTSFLAQEDHLYRIHFTKKGDPPVSLSIGGKDENHFFLIANNKSDIFVNNKCSVSFLDEISFSGDYPNNALQEIDEMLAYLDSADYPGLSIKTEFLHNAIYEKLRYYADTCSHPIVSLYALYKSKFESNYPLNKQFYKDYLKKWKNKKSSYHKAFRAQLGISQNKEFYGRLIIGLSFFIIGVIITILFRKYRSKNKNLLNSLSVQERKIFTLLKEGKSNKEISEEFNIGLSTVKSHVNNIYSKLNINSRKESMNFEQ
ncbi:helix-turn-helix transcriptional regulator [Bacteroidota bacterium]